MLEKMIIMLERLQVRMERNHQRKSRERSLRFAKSEINRLARLRVL